MSGMTVSQLLQGAPDIPVKRICYNSAKVQAGDVFVAIKGLQTDGHQYALDAQEKGAVCVVCQHPIEGLSIPAVVVEDSRKALAQMARAYYQCPDKQMVIIGVTGTNGKTTVTSLVKQILDNCGYCTGLIGTNGNMIGQQRIPAERTTPESLELMKLLRQMADAGCTHVVMEVSSHSLELDRVYGCEFDIGAFTNLSQDHLDFHGTMGNYLEAKAKLFERCRKAAVNMDDKASGVLLQRATCPVLGYGIHKGECMASNIETTSAGVRFDVGDTRYVLGIPGIFSVYNALTTIAICTLLGMEAEKIAHGLAKAGGITGRAEIIPNDRNFTLMIDYAHTPDGLRNILESVRGFATGRVVVLFGCGGDRDQSKRAQMGRIAGELADVCIVTSDNPRSEDPSHIIRDILEGMKEATADYVVLEDRTDAIRYAIGQAQPGDVVVLAGKGHETKQVLADKTIHFDEHEIVRAVLAQLS